MSGAGKPLSGGCLCGALRYAATAEPRYMGHCYCSDCRKASGSGFIPFMVFAGDQLRFSGESRTYITRSARGGDAVRNFCPACGGLVFGGQVGKDQTFTVYAGSLDDPGAFEPKIAIFTRDRPDWATIPPGLKVFEGMPG